MGQNFSASESESDIFCPITSVFISRTFLRSRAISSSVTVGLMTCCSETCCPCAFPSAAALPPLQAVATNIPATKAPANPTAPAHVHFIVFLLTLVPLSRRESQVSVHLSTVRGLKVYSGDLG